MKAFKKILGKLGRIVLVTGLVGAAVLAQSTDQSNPTPVTTNEVGGTIPARDLGDSRLTNYFYIFNGNQGDVFINVVTTNLDGDIDVFTLDGLRPLTKITIFSDLSDTETGRVVYLRKFEKLLLRVQGRSPNDQPATFRIKFAGSFQPLENFAGNTETGLPEVNRAGRGDVRVNSVGTILAPVPTPIPVETPQPERKKKEINVKSVDEQAVAENTTKIEISRTRPTGEEVDPEKPAENDQPSRAKPVVIITEPDLPEKVDGVEPVPEEVTDPEKPAVPVETVESVEPLTANQLRGIDLVIKFKNGTEVRRPLNQVFNFNVNQGILRVVTNDGKVFKYSMLEVEMVSIQ